MNTKVPPFLDVHQWFPAFPQPDGSLHFREELDEISTLERSRPIGTMDPGLGLARRVSA